jgi:hypothetical protein
MAVYPVYPPNQLPPAALEQANVPRANLQLDAMIQTVRTYMRDFEELNRLIKGVENSNRQIVWAILDALDDFNTSPPMTSFGLHDFPSRSLLVRGTAIALLESVGILMTRNHLDISDGGMTVGINNKTPYIQSWLQILKNSYEEKKDRLKRAINIERAWGGGLHSEYAWASQSYYGEAW